MLAYVFWHWPAAGVEQHAYEQLQLAFHRALAEAGMVGLEHSHSFKIDGQAPWLGGAPAYSDWYVLDGSAALDRLNEVAVSSARRGPHDVLARASSAGVGSLLAVQSGSADIAEARLATWVAKPRGMPYEPFYARLRPILSDSGVSLWRRQMVLGPTPEFGLLSRTPIALPAGLEQLTLGLESITP